MTDMNENKPTTILLVAILLTTLVGVVVSSRPKIIQITPEIAPTVEPNFGYGGYNEFTSGVTHSVISISISTAATATNLALATNTAAMYRRLQNVGSTNITCQLTSATTSLAAGTGIVLFASSSVNSIYEIGPNNLYKGAIKCIATTATGTLSVIER